MRLIRQDVTALHLFPLCKDWPLQLFNGGEDPGQERQSKPQQKDADNECLRVTFKGEDIPFSSKVLQYEYERRRDPQKLCDESICIHQIAFDGIYIPEYCHA